MEKKIAVILDENEEISAFQIAKKLILYSCPANIWVQEKTVDLDGLYSGGMAEIRNKVGNLLEEIGDCKIIAGKNITGFIYNILDGAGVIISEMDNFEEDDLEKLYRQIEKELRLIEAETEEILAIPTTPIETEVKGNYFFDFSLLKKVAEGHSSKNTILPFLNTTEFNNLEIVCDHVMPWFEGEMDKRGLTFETKEREDKKISIQIFRPQHKLVK